MFEINVHPLAPEKVPEWINLLNEAQLRCPGYMPVTDKTVGLWPMCGDFPPGRILMASLGGLPIAAVSVSMQENRGILSHFVVIQGFRRQGIGRQLMEAALQELKHGGAGQAAAVCWAFEPYARFFAGYGLFPIFRYLKVVWRLSDLPRTRTQVEIREGTSEDVPEIIDLCARTYLPDWQWFWRDEAKLKEVAQRFFTKTLSGSGRRQVLVAVQDGQIVGISCPWVDEAFVSETGIHEGMLAWGIGVLPEYRRRGIGTALLRAALERLREWGMEHACVWTMSPFDNDSPALACYRAAGGVITMDWMVLETVGSMGVKSVGSS